MPVREICKFSVSYMQILDEQGNVDTDLEPRLSNEQLLQMMRDMLRGRELDARMLALQRQGRIGTFAPNTGQEATQVGPATAMTDKDWLVPSFREASARLMRGDSIVQFLMYHAGYEEGCVNDPPSTRVLPIQVIVGGQIPHAVGIGYSIKYREEQNAGVVCFFGDGSTSEGDFHEGLNFAALWQVPCVFICQNNQWAISVPREKQTFAKTIAQKALAYDIPTIQVDGNDVLCTYKVTRDALDRAYNGGGPTFIEAVTYRMWMHTTADDPRKYREEAEVEEWAGKDPIARFHIYLKNKGLLTDAGLEEIRAEVKAEVAKGVTDFEEITKGGIPGNPRWKVDAPFDHIYGVKYPIIEEQREQFLADLKKEVASG